MTPLSCRSAAAVSLQKRCSPLGQPVAAPGRKLRWCLLGPASSCAKQSAGRCGVSPRVAPSPGFDRSTPAAASKRRWRWRRRGWGTPAGAATPDRGCGRGTTPRAGRDRACGAPRQPARWGGPKRAIQALQPSPAGSSDRARIPACFCRAARWQPAHTMQTPHLSKTAACPGDHPPAPCDARHAVFQQRLRPPHPRIPAPECSTAELGPGERGSGIAEVGPNGAMAVVKAASGSVTASFALQQRFFCAQAPAVAHAGSRRCR